MACFTSSMSFNFLPRRAFFIAREGDSHLREGQDCMVEEAKSPSFFMDGIHRGSCRARAMADLFLTVIYAVFFDRFLLSNWSLDSFLSSNFYPKVQLLVRSQVERNIVHNYTSITVLQLQSFFVSYFIIHAKWIFKIIVSSRFSIIWINDASLLVFTAAKHSSPLMNS